MDEDEDGFSVIEPGEVGITLEDESGHTFELTGTMFLDKEGNETDIFYDAVTVLCRSPELEWYEIDIKDQSWERPIIH